MRTGSEDGRAMRGCELKGVGEGGGRDDVGEEGKCVWDANEWGACGRRPVGRSPDGGGVWPKAVGRCPDGG